MDDFDAFVRATAPSLTRFAYVLCGHAHTTEDLVQAALVKVHRAWDRVRVMDAQEAYARRVIVHEYVSWRRKRSSAEIPIQDAAAQLDTPSGDATADRIVETDAMWEALNTLPPKQRATLVLRYYLDWPDEQIAEALSCSTGTVRSHLSRGLHRLRTASPFLTPQEGSGS